MYKFHKIAISSYGSIAYTRLGQQQMISVTLISKMTASNSIDLYMYILEKLSFNIKFVVDSFIHYENEVIGTNIFTVIRNAKASKIPVS